MSSWGAKGLMENIVYFILDMKWFLVVLWMWTVYSARLAQLYEGVFSNARYVPDVLDTKSIYIFCFACVLVCYPNFAEAWYSVLAIMFTDMYV
jgi:hypothetical protein